MVVAERVLRVSVQILPVSMNATARFLSGSAGMAGKNNPAGALRRVRRGPITGHHSRTRSSRTICDPRVIAVAPRLAMHWKGLTHVYTEMAPTIEPDSLK